MASTKKRILGIALATTIVAGGYLYLNAGSLITKTAERIASDALGVNVNIGSIHVSLADKNVTVSTLHVGNPPGYSKPYAMTADKILIGLNTASKKIIDFKDIQVKGSVVNFEVNEHGVNLNDLKRLANRKEQKESVGSEQVRVIIQHMVIDSSTINPTITLLKRDIPAIHLPPVKFSNIGKGGGLDANDAIVQVMGKYLTSVENAARSEGLMNGLAGQLENVDKTVGAATSEIQKMFK